MIRRHSFRRSVMGVCATLLVAAQVLGLHYHRHLHEADAGHGRVAELHLRDAGVHAPHADHDHHAVTDRAAHPGIDLEVDVIAEGLRQQKQVQLLAVLPAAFAQPVAVTSRPVRATAQRLPGEPPARYALAPPSRAPPFLRVST